MYNGKAGKTAVSANTPSIADAGADQRMARRRRTLAWVALSVTGVATVWACGPEFPLQLLDDRAGTLKSTPANSFAYEAAHLVTAKDALKAKETTVYADAAAADHDDPAKLEVASLSAAQRAQLKAMRDAAGNGDAAFALGEGLPAAIRAYAAGAVDYRTGQGEDMAALQSARYASAQKRFQSVLDLPKADSQPRAVGAAYMLGRLHAGAHFATDANAATERDAAVRAFELTRSLAQQGAPDPWGLAVASFGEQARLYLTDGKQSCDWTSLSKNDACATAIAPADLKRAIALYAEQAARSSDSGMNSLAFIADWALSDASRAKGLIDDPLAQRLLVAYALARVGDIVDGDASSAAEYWDRSAGGTGYSDTARGTSTDCCGNGPSHKVRPHPILVTLVEAIRARGLDRVAGADRLAALAYRGGQYDVAQALVDKYPSALSSWVRAKLAVRKGDMAAAAQAYADAVQGFPRLGDSLDADSVNEVKGEQGVLALSRGQYVEAFGFLYDAANQAGNDSGLSYDMAYVAERVLSTDELKAFVDAHVPATPAPAMPRPSETGYVGFPPRAVADTLRALLARRLVRESRIAESVAYFPANGDSRYADYAFDYQHQTTKVTPSALRTWVRAYGDALHDAEHAWTRVGRAQAWFTAATIAREHGMELMGYEQDPDYAFVGGSYDGGAGRSLDAFLSPADRDPDRHVVPTPQTPNDRALAMLLGPFVTDGERERYAASEARPYKRFHYRFVAVDQMQKAADLLPPRSQAFAAVLCKAAGWGTGEEGALYRRYVKDGAHVAFAKNFGTQCETPDFHAAARFPYTQAWNRLRSWIHHHWYIPLGSVVAILGAVGSVGWWYRRRRRSSLVTGSHG